jgi:hypothetical protein
MTERQERQRMLRIAQERLQGWCEGSPYAQSFPLDRTAYRRNTNTCCYFVLVVQWSANSEIVFSIHTWGTFLTKPSLCTQHHLRISTHYQASRHSAGKPYPHPGQLTKKNPCQHARHFSPPKGFHSIPGAHWHNGILPWPLCSSAGMVCVMNYFPHRPYVHFFQWFKYLIFRFVDLNAVHIKFNSRWPWKESLSWFCVVSCVLYLASSCYYISCVLIPLHI